MGEHHNIHSTTVLCDRLFSTINCMIMIALKCSRMTCSEWWSMVDDNNELETKKYNCAVEL